MAALPVIVFGAIHGASAGRLTAYALLEKRFGLGARRFTSIVFMATRGMADSVRVFATAVPIALIIGPLLPQRAVMPVAVLVLGTLTVLYTIRGGMRAVVWTEIVQASVYLFGGIAAVVIVGHLVSGGWDQITTAASASRRKTQTLAATSGSRMRSRNIPHTEQIRFLIFS